MPAKPVNGGVGQWLEFGACTKSCGPGKKTRSRKCTNPTPANGGKSCQEQNLSMTDEQDCENAKCPGK